MNRAKYNHQMGVCKFHFENPHIFVNWTDSS